MYAQPGGLDNYAESILVGGIVFTPDLSDPYHPFYTGSTGTIVVNESRNEWQFIPTGSSMEDDTYFSPCLISTFTGGMGSINVTDLFEPFYHVTIASGDDYHPDGTFKLDRHSLCMWLGEDACGNAIALHYAEVGLDGYPQWQVSFLRYLSYENCEVATDGTYPIVDVETKVGLETPVGTYSGIASVA